MDVLSATDVRKNWSETLDSVVHERPAYIKRTRDNLAIINLKTLNDILAGYIFKAKKYKESDGSVTLSAVDLDLVVNERDEASARKALAAEIKEYAEDFYDHFSTWSIAPNRRNHIPYVMKALSLDEVSIEEGLICRIGKN
jgi:hypothetical protein